MVEKSIHILMSKSTQEFYKYYKYRMLHSNSDLNKRTVLSAKCKSQSTHYAEKCPLWT